MSEAADYAGVCTNTIRKWRAQGVVHPKHQVRPLGNNSHRAVMVFDREELRRHRGARETPKAPVDAGAQAARAFALFREGTPLADVVMQLQAPPQLVEELHDQWHRMGGCELVINPAAKAGFERIVGPFDGVADLLERVEHLAKQVAGPGEATAEPTHT